MGVVFREADGNRAAYYDVRYKEKNTNIWKHAKFSVNMYGKYAKEIADYAVLNGVRLNNWFEERDDCIVIFIYDKQNSNELECYIDKDDFDLVKKYHWGCKYDSAEIYARASTKNPNDKNEKIYMHQLIMGTWKNPDIVVDHIYGNGLNNRRNNLRITTDAINKGNRVNVPVNNTTGRVGVNEDDKNINVKFTKPDGEIINKSWSKNKYGRDEALRRAIECREALERQYKPKE